MKLWIARDKYGLWLLATKPYIDNDMFTCDSNIYRIDCDLFHEVTFENSPKQIELNVVNDDIDFDDEESNFQKIDIYDLQIGDYICIECERFEGDPIYLKIVDIQQRFDAITGEPIIIVTDEEDEIWSTKTGRCLSNPKSFYELVDCYREI